MFLYYDLVDLVSVPNNLLFEPNLNHGEMPLLLPIDVNDARDIFGRVKEGFEKPLVNESLPTMLLDEESSAVYMADESDKRDGLTRQVGRVEDDAMASVRERRGGRSGSGRRRRVASGSL